MFLPLYFRTEGLACLVVGGGDVAARKLEMLSELGCRITVEAPEICPAVRAVLDCGDSRWIAREYRTGDCNGYQLVIAATKSREVNRAVFEEARTLEIPVNVVDDPELCTVVFPAIWRDGPLMVAVSTGGTAPFMAAAIRDRLAAHAAGMGQWVVTANRFRQAVRKAVKEPDERHRLYQEFLAAPSLENAAGAPESVDLEVWRAWLNRIKCGR
jgi:uroporphyrin-III C-methyltransferase/precorrin-2 dehydrogenase/sirohydrochlorin ferrochelatase